MELSINFCTMREKDSILGFSGAFRLSELASQTSQSVNGMCHFERMVLQNLEK